MTRIAFGRRMVQSDLTPNQTLRRNGKVQSCEPCRRRKLRCDHLLPTCGRCARQNRPEQCFYHPAPLTKSRDLQAADQVDVTISLSPRTQSHSSPSEIPLPSAERAPYVSPVSNNSIESAHPPCTSIYSRDNGFFGPTSYTALITEQSNSLGMAENDDHVHPTGEIRFAEAKLEKGAEILALFDDMPLFTRFIDRWFEASGPVIVIEPIMKQWMSEMYAAHRRVLQSRDLDQLETLSEQVWRNTQSPLIFDSHTTPRQWTSLFTGERLRWEVVALILSTVGHLCGSLLDGDPIFNVRSEQPFNRRAFSIKVCEAADVCLAFCNELCVLSDPLIWALFENRELGARIRGYTSWQGSGELLNALTAAGLHQEIKVDEKTPWFLTELRKKLFVFGFAYDKSYSTFVGRPPRLSQRYCLLQLPLDLEDRDLMSDQFDLESARATIDENGWNLQGKIQQSTSARIYAQNALIEEEILELSLGVAEQDIMQRANQIEERAERNWRDLPEFLRREDDDSFDTKRNPGDMIFIIFVRMKHLNNLFVLQRTLVKRVGADTSRLRSIAQKLFANAMTFVHNRESFTDLQLDYTVLLQGFGIPSAAVLAVELLRQDQSTPSNFDPLPRSELVQELSVFAACLKSMRVEGAMRCMCEQGRRFLKKVLDLILSPQSSSLSTPTPTFDFLPGLDGVTPPMPDDPFLSASDTNLMSWLDALTNEPMTTAPFSV